MLIEFEKWSAALNDFIVVWVKDTQDFIISSLVQNSKMLCRKDGGGIGADGILVIKYSLVNDFKQLIIINADGSYAKTCGNGLRCVALSVQRHHLEKHNTPLEYCQFQLEDRIITCTYILPSKINNLSNIFVSVNMGQVKLDDKNHDYDYANQQIQNFLNALDSTTRSLLSDYHFCDIGNKHFVFLAQNPSRDLIQRIGLVFNNILKTDEVNVHIYNIEELGSQDFGDVKKYLRSVSDEVLVAYSWERGVGFTQACGSGACAIVTAALKDKILSNNKDWIAVKMPGGFLYVKVLSLDSDVFLAGSAYQVFWGRIEI